MPYRRTYRPRRRAPVRRRRYGRALATVPRMMPRGLAFKRMNQVSTKVFWFKYNGQLATDIQTDDAYLAFLTQDLISPAVGVPQYPSVFQLYDQYKVLAMKVKLFPANIGTEPSSWVQGAWNRGDHIMWSDQRFEANAQIPILINQVINNASAKMIDPRRMYSRTLYRPKGHSEWGSCQEFTSNPDSWRGAIQFLANNSSSGRVLYFYTVQFKVVVRGRRQE